MTRLRGITKFEDLTEHEERVLRFIAKNGQTNRKTLVIRLADASTNTGQRMNNGSNGAVPLIAANWCRRLLKSKLIIDIRDTDANHKGYKVSAAGRALLKAKDAS